MATRMGLEPTTSAVTGRRSNQLSHRANCFNVPSKPHTGNCYDILCYLKADCYVLRTLTITVAIRKSLRFALLTCS